MNMWEETVEWLICNPGSEEEEERGDYQAGKRVRGRSR